MGIKSFQGHQAEAVKHTTEKIAVRDCMQKRVITFTEEMTLFEAMKRMIKHKVSGGPVVNHHNEVVGIVSEGDCVKQISYSRYYNMPLSDVNVEHKMNRSVETVSPNENIFDVANKFLHHKRRRFPVVEEGKLLGLVSQKIIIKLALELTGNHWKK